MTLFKKAENTAGYLKMGVMGFPKSGKTYTSTLVAIGLHKYIKSTQPIYFYDTELGSSYVKGLFDENGIELQRIQSRAFLTLIGALSEVPEGGIFLIDSITHPWRDLLKGFMKAKGITRIKMNHWDAIKTEWSQFNDWFLNSKVHVIMCGRAGYEFDMEEDEEGKKDLVKTGIKMKTEGELGFEPSLLVEMYAKKEMEENGRLTKINNMAFIMGDRFHCINGQTFEMPNFETFLPHIQRLNLNGYHSELDKADSSTMFSSDKSVSERLKKRDILVEELKNELTLRFSARTDEGKKNALNFLKDTYGTTSMTAIEGMDNDRIHDGLMKLKATPTTKE